jgi:drug/metabolite transporter (DMT)-like permease
MAMLAVLSGMCFSVVAIAYRLGAPRGVGPVHIMGTASLVGSAFFGVRALAALDGGPSGPVVALGLLAGVTQYMLLPLIRAALRVGPLSPLWCVLMLSFIPVTLYSCVALGERLVPLQYGAMAAAVVCVVMACVGKEPSRRPGVGPARPLHRLRYGAVLAAMLLVGAVSPTCLKELSARGDGAGATLLARYRDLFLAMLYVGIAVCAAGDVLLTRGRPASWRLTGLLGAMAAAGSLAGMSLLVRAAVLPAAVVFTLNSVSSIVFTAVVAAVWLGERRTRSWYATLGCGILAVALANGEAIAQYLRSS